MSNDMNQSLGGFTPVSEKIRKLVSNALMGLLAADVEASPAPPPRDVSEEEKEMVETIIRILKGEYVSTGEVDAVIETYERQMHDETA